MEKFAGLNFRGFIPTEVFAEILSHLLSQKCLLLKSGAQIHGKTFAVLLKTVKFSPVNLSPFTVVVDVHILFHIIHHACAVIKFCCYNQGVVCLLH